MSNLSGLILLMKRMNEGLALELARTLAMTGKLSQAECEFLYDAMGW